MKTTSRVVDWRLFLFKAENRLVLRWVDQDPSSSCKETHRLQEKWFSLVDIYY